MVFVGHIGNNVRRHICGGESIKVETKIFNLKKQLLLQLLFSNTCNIHCSHFVEVTQAAFLLLFSTEGFLISIYDTSIKVERKFFKHKITVVWPGGLCNPLYIVFGRGLPLV